ncbi:MAG: hypothetical protein A2469_04375 [Candidatus Magasanikbacteria bacterium RIFOXYC2_FULL_40_16]|uniref:Integrase catalytic domain-containing protein n=3 Tax=Candidatus Magasanikiibacteriota TaxID=1752731 RepID=A0A1F6NH90_9BACT|nr:MAG: hypothetical protein A2373_04595 [Candidatus Magasanikbacteria bacterium RIFOXYB1_FULL_40_15]OGH87204.1 MAG: hypothetical protein A2206_00705 [Candidatus Magasanikbacteria bacterium RIFOXYA1_FULL_40_8]OGH90297.1 MAG: hypothetical protein A2469_04375 [Candidatus Magasanikbacteria bacterium RIFOXYC2_FULL_40_16]
MGKKELIKATKKRYAQASKLERGKILDEFCLNTKYHRNYASTILQPSYDNNKVANTGRKSRKKKYGPDIMIVIIKIWELLDYPCGTRLKPMLLPMAEALVRSNELKINNKLKKQLKSIGTKTLDRRLEKKRIELKLHKNRGTTRHGSLLKTAIPIRITNWDTSKIGFMEMDTVAHSGGDPSGEFVYSLDMVEIYSGWSEQRAILGKGEKGVIMAIDDVKNIVPFSIPGLDSDGGSEFINWHLVRYCEKHDIFFTRSRPYMKNDNAYVEQKNYTHIRKWLGYGRYDTAKQVEMMNDLYKNELNLFNNFFRPVMKIQSKEKVNNSVCKKKYDTAKTPYQRLIESDQITQETRQKLKKLYLSLNPVQLKKATDEKIKNIKKTTK